MLWCRLVPHHRTMHLHQLQNGSCLSLSGTPPAKRAKHAAGAKATAAATSGGVRPRLQPTDSEVMARINLSAAAQNIKVNVTAGLE